MGNFWREVTTAAWVANTGIPLLMTLATIVFGFWIVRRQLQHGRMMLAAQRRAQAAHTLGAALVRESERGGKATADPFWHNDRYGGFGRVSDAVDDAGIVLTSTRNGSAARPRRPRRLAMVCPRG